MDRLYDRLPDQPMEIVDGGMIIDKPMIQWGVVTNSRQLEQIVEVVVPYFTYEFGMKSVYPRVAAFIPFEGMAAFHVLGRASCVDSVWIANYGYVNPYAHLYRRDNLLPTIVHEQGHVNGICGGNSAIMEGANQIATWEILAAMSNHGNKYAIKPLVGELRDAALDYTRATIHQAGADPLYQAFVLSAIYTTPEERSRVNKSWRFWADNQETLDYIIEAYGMKPWVYLQFALADPDHRTAKDFYSYPCPAGTIRVDDLAWFLSHLDEVEQIAKQKALD